MKTMLDDIVRNRQLVVEQQASYENKGEPQPHKQPALVEQGKLHDGIIPDSSSEVNVSHHVLIDLLYSCLEWRQ